MTLSVLQDILRIEDEQFPLANNIVSSMIMVLYFKVIMEVTSWLRYRFRMKNETTRQILHIAFSSIVIFWPLFDLSDGWSWRLNVLLPSVLMARLVYKVIKNDPDDMDVQNFSRSSSPYELLWGPLQLTLVYIWLGLTKFMTVEAAVVAASVGMGDGLAPLVGIRYGRHHYSTPLATQRKTMEGTVVGVFLGTTVGSYLYLYLMKLPLPPLRIILVYGGIAAVIEGISPGNLDNLCLPLVLHFSMDRVQDWLCPPATVVAAAATVSPIIMTTATTATTAAANAAAATTSTAAAVSDAAAAVTAAAASDAASTIKAAATAAAEL